jgi:hypothetical protein
MAVNMWTMIISWLSTHLINIWQIYEAIYLLLLVLKHFIEKVKGQNYLKVKLKTFVKGVVSNFGYFPLFFFVQLNINKIKKQKFYNVNGLKKKLKYYH